MTQPSSTASRGTASPKPNLEEKSLAPTRTTETRLSTQEGKISVAEGVVQKIAGMACREIAGVALGQMVFIRRDASADERFAEACGGVDHELVGAGHGIDRECHAGRDRWNHALHENADPPFLVVELPRAPIRARLLGLSR